ncbi:integral membrane protein [Neofusicoccum parvum]|uniref:Integral membrane protein n=1 Tax=Neofusicoccum parvum TaxID=310453 RepID=A0ACB5SMV3_9PEZI|nr:integral membrane protein [Neofusicoccum parvum]
MVAPGLDPPEGEVSNFNDQSSTVKTAALAVNVAGIAITTALFALRMVARFLVSRRYGIDDLCCIIAYAVYATMVIYGPTVFATKAAILLFLTRVFQPYERYCRFVFAFTMLMGCYYTLMLFLKIFICRPIHLFWDTSDEGECFNQRALILADSIISLVSDIAVLLIPCPLATGLKVATAAKLRIAAVFGAGGVACVCTFIRLMDIVKMGASADQTYSFTLINLWGIAEVGIGLVCACFPVLPAFWKYVRKQHPSQHASSHARTGGGGGIELTRKSRHSSSRHTASDAPRKSVGARMYDGSEENMLIPPREGTMTTRVQGGWMGDDLELGGKLMDSGRTSMSERRGGGGEKKGSCEEQGIVKTVQVQMMREPK